MRKAIVGTVAVLGLVLGAGCASTQVTSTWKNPTVARNEVPKKVLVVAMLPNVALQNQVEQQASAKLTEEGIASVPLSHFLAPGTPVNREQIAQVVRENGFDGLLVSRFKGTTEHVSYVPGAYGYGPYFDSFAPYAYSPGYVTVTTQRKMETSLFDTHGEGTLLWTASSNTIPSGSAQKDVSKYVTVLLNRMQKDVLG